MPRTEQTRALRDIFTPLVAHFSDRVLRQNLLTPYLPHKPSLTRTQIQPYGELRGDPPSFFSRIIHYSDLPRFSEFALIERPDLKELDIVVPVGQYGQAWSQALALAADTLYTLATDPSLPTNVLAETTKIDADPESIEWLSKATTRGFLKTAEAGIPTADSLGSLLEGIQSVAAASGLLTAYAVPEFSSPLDFLRAIIDSPQDSPIVSLSNRANQGVVFPSANSGYHFHHPLAIGEGEPTLTDYLIDFLMAEKRAKRQAAPVSAEKGGLLSTGDGCPAGKRNAVNPDGGVYKESGIQMLLEVFFIYTEYFYNQLADPTAGRRRPQ